jgi:2-polyprenyl-3-methyl-5-hydroxy-6-metoxy-1,4-benzoquinol methylase
MKLLFKKPYRRLISSVKQLDKVTGYKIGNIFRELTNVNTRKYWDSMFSKKENFLRDYPYRPLTEVLPRDKVFSLLDIGCAMGDGLELLAKSFPLAKFSGADLSPAGIEKALAKTKNIDYFVLDITKDELPKKYDFITLVHVLEHINDPFPIVDKCLKFVNEALIICTPYIEQFDNPRLYLSGEHRYLFNEHTFDRYNFQILKISEHIEAGGYKYILYKLKP